MQTDEEFLVSWYVHLLGHELQTLTVTPNTVDSFIRKGLPTIFGPGRRVPKATLVVLLLVFLRISSLRVQKCLDYAYVRPSNTQSFLFLFCYRRNHHDNKICN